jgi:hypothetical protein
MTLIQARVPVVLARKVKVKAAKEGTSIQQLIIEALENLLQQPKKERH